MPRSCYWYSRSGGSEERKLFLDRHTKAKFGVQQSHPSQDQKFNEYTIMALTMENPQTHRRNNGSVIFIKSRLVISFIDQTPDIRERTRLKQWLIVSCDQELYKRPF